MAENFNFVVPQHSDFTSIEYESEHVETYFDFDHERPDNYSPEFKTPMHSKQDMAYPDENDFFNTPMSSEDIMICPKVDNVSHEEPRKMRKSLSTSCLPGIKNEDYKIKEHLSNQIKKMNINGSTKSLCDKKRGRSPSYSKSYGSSSSLNRIPSKASLNQNERFVSTAEFINKFQNGTPTRFHSKPKATVSNCGKPCGPIPCTIPQSPALHTKNRHRPVTVLSTEEREMLEYEEAKKFKIKVNPVNVKMFEGPVKPSVPVQKKPTTIVQPFNITGVRKKTDPSPKKVPEFHAQPVPKNLYNPPKPIIKSQLRTEAITPEVLRKHALKMKQIEKPKDQEKRVLNKLAPTRTKVVPFSFEKRDQALMKRRELFIQKCIEEERKKHEVQARPLNKNIFDSPEIKPKMNLKAKTRSHPELRSSLESVRSNKSDGSTGSGTSINKIGFKAKPANVLQMQPFVPKKEERPMIDITEFQLNTNRRAAERAEYERKQKEKLDTLELIKEQREQQKLLQEQEEIARLRREAQHVAQPIRHYKEVKPVPPKPLTNPVTPKLATNRLRNKENESDDIAYLF